MQPIDVHEAKEQLAHLINAATRGESVYIVNDDDKVVQLVPVQNGLRRPRFASAAQLIVLADNFDEPLTDFGEYME